MAHDRNGHRRTRSRSSPQSVSQSPPSTHAGAGRSSDADDGDTFSLLSRGPRADRSRLPLFRDAAGERDVPGALHLQSDDAIARVAEAHAGGAVRLLRQFAEDLARRDVEINELRRQADNREKVLKAMLVEVGVARSEIERRLLGLANGADGAVSQIRHETLDDSLREAMSDTQSLDELSVDRSRADTTDAEGTPKAALNRKSSLAKWSLGFFGGRRPIPSPSLPEAQRDGPASRKTSRETVSRRSSHRLQRKVSTAAEGSPSERFEFATEIPKHLEWRLVLDRYPEKRPPPHYLAVVRAREIRDLALLTMKSSERIARHAQRLVVGINAYEIRDSEDLGVESPAKLTPNPNRGESRPWQTIKDTAQSVLRGDESDDDGPVEMRTFIPETDRPPTMLPAWTDNGALSRSGVLTDRFGFRLSNVRDRQREQARDGSTSTEPVTQESASDSASSRSALVGPLASTPASPPLSVDALDIDDDRLLRRGKAGLGLVAATPSKPLTPATTLDQTSATFDTTDTSQAKLLMLSQRDLYGSDRAKQEQWDAFLKRCRRDRRRGAKSASLTVVDGGDDEPIGLAGLLNSKNGREKRRELMSLVFRGIPMALRPSIWCECTGASLLKEPQRYEDLLNRGTDTDPVCVQQIDMDVHRTMPSNVFFAGTGPGTVKLRRVLIAFSRHNQEVGYCQGLNNLAGTLLLTLPTEQDAFFVLAGIVDKILPQRYFTPDLLTSRADQIVLNALVRQLLPKLAEHLADVVGADLEAVTFGWFLSVFTDCLPAELLFRCWDVSFLEGHPYLFAVALAILKAEQSSLMRAETPGQVYTALKELRHVKELSADAFIDMTAGFHTYTGNSARSDLTAKQLAAVQTILGGTASSTD